MFSRIHCIVFLFLVLLLIVAILTYLKAKYFLKLNNYFAPNL